MINQLTTISENTAKAAELLKQVPASDKNIENFINENAYQIKQLEKYSATLVENIELTIKANKV